MFDDIKKIVLLGEHRFTLHALERCMERNISPDVIKKVVFSGEVIESYPLDKYGPSCLICGSSEDGRILHVQCSIDPVLIITAYDPTLEPDEWSNDFKRRR